MGKCYLADFGCACVLCCLLLINFQVWYQRCRSRTKHLNAETCPGELVHDEILLPFRHIHKLYFITISQFSATESRMIAVDNYNRLHWAFWTHSQFFTSLSSLGSLRKQKGITGVTTHPPRAHLITLCNPITISTVIAIILSQYHHLVTL